jgi:NADH:ubiquinone oxidoreductase subunit F (NADH-binding)
MQLMKKTHFKSFLKAVEIDSDAIIEMVIQSNLKGRGGAAFLAGQKWKFVKMAKGNPKYLICNFDEGEPGTFKDKFIADNNPDIIIEGIAIACYAMEIKKAYIYLRGEYKYLVDVLEKSIKENKSHLKKIDLDIEIFLGAGAYICGDETSIMNSIEGIRAEPRKKPPFPANIGLFQKPTCINNVETLANVPLILDNSFENTFLFSISGDVLKPGVYEAKKGISAKELIDMAKPKKRIKALFFGAAGGCVKYRDNLILDDETIKSEKASLGSGTIIVVDESRKIPKICENIMEFFVHESCGKCTPCREGSMQILKLLKEKKLNKNLLMELSFLAKDASFCGLGQTVGSFMISALNNFDKEFENYANHN